MVAITIDTNIFDADIIYTIMQILTKMGWGYDELEEDGYLRVRVPIKEENLFDFIFENYL